MDKLTEELAKRLFAENSGPDSGTCASTPTTGPVHVFYGGADLFKADTASKLGRLALNSLDTYAPDIHSFATAMWLRGAESIPHYPEVVAELESKLAADPDGVRATDEGAWFAWTVRERVRAKLEKEPVEDFRIDFEDGFGLRPDEEEDLHATRAAGELARAAREGTAPRRSGIRIKAFRPETFARATRTLEMFLTELTSALGGVPDGFVVTLPKVSRPAEVSALADLLAMHEERLGLARGSTGIEIMVETPDCLFDLRETVRAGDGRVTSAHFGAYDYTASLGITAQHQHLGHDACNFARSMMQAALAPMGLRLSDSVTTEMPVPVHRVEIPTAKQDAENRKAVHSAWRRHFNNVTGSLINGFFQSWDLHPAQLVPRYAAVTAFFLDGAEEQALRLRGFIDRATKATLHGTVFDDAASAQGYLNFFARALATGSIPPHEVLKLTGLSADEIRSLSFNGILEGRKTLEG